MDELRRSRVGATRLSSDAIQVIAYFNYINRVADAVGIEDEPEWTADDDPA